MNNAIYDIYPGSIFKQDDSKYGRDEYAITIPAEDGTRLHGWFYNRGSDTALIAMYCGNCMNAGDFHFMASVDKKNSYLLINYRGFGSSEGEPSERAIVQDACYCLKQARNIMGNHTGPIYLGGYSLGSGVAIQVATEITPDRLVLICPFDKFSAVLNADGNADLSGYDTWNSASFAPRITCPVHVMYGEFDTIVPPDSTMKLVSVFCTPPCLKCYPTAHNDIFYDTDFLQDLKQVLTSR